MSIRQGKKLIASSTTNGFSLFDCKWADHILNNMSWLRADTFSWQSGDVYIAAYEHLAVDLDTVQKLYCWIGEKMGDKYYTYSESPSVGETTTDGDAITRFDSYGRPVIGAEYLDRYPDGDTLSTQTDTVGDITITYYSAEDGHKICLPDQESNLSSLYENIGVAWYYILDTANKQFKLPRTKFGFTGIRSGVGGYVEPGLPNIEGSFRQRRDNSANTVSVSGAFSYSNVGDSGSFYYGNNNTSNGQQISFNASSSNNIYGNSDTVQPQATEMYLYFYVGNYVENATTIDVGKLTEIVNDFDIDTFKPEVDEAKSSAIVDISDAKTDAIDSLTNLATDLGTSLKYGNVGDIFYTSRLDVSLNGAVECNGNLYNTTDFSGAQSIGNLLRDSKVPYISLTEHQTTIDTYGSCRCFGWDGGTEFRVPKLADVFIEAGVAASEGEFITAGLPDHTHTRGTMNITGTLAGTSYTSGSGASGAFYTNGSSVAKTADGGDNRPQLSFDASRSWTGETSSASNSIYGNSTTVQPPAVRYRAMVQLAFGATDEAVVTAGNVVADVSELNSHRVIAFQAPTSTNGYTWYRKYADGWVEQGGRTTTFTNTANGTSDNKTVSLPVAMLDSNYTAIATRAGSGSGWSWRELTIDGKTTTAFLINQWTNAAASGTTCYAEWQVSGMAA